MNLFSFASISLFLLCVMTLCTLYIMAALSRFSAQILEFKQYRELEFDKIINSLQIRIESINNQFSDDKFTKLQQLEELMNQVALQSKLSREDVFAIRSDNEMRFSDLSKRMNELAVHFQQLHAEFKAISST